MVNVLRYPLLRLLRNRRPLRRSTRGPNSRFYGLSHAPILDFMRSAALGLCCLAGLQLNAQQASFSGVAINSITRGPLAGVHVTLLSIRKFPEPNQPYGAVSGPDGRFSIPNLPPGVYQLLPKHNGFLYLQDENKDSQEVRILLKQGEDVTDRTVAMTPVAILTGRVTDEFGDPVEGAFVNATPVTGDPSRSVVQSRMNGVTDELGQFRITGVPGRVRISAKGGSLRLGVTEIRSDGSEIPVYAETWYPSTDSRDRGTVVEAIGGRETAGNDISLIRKRSLTLSGIVTGTPQGPGRVEVLAHTRSFGLPFTTPDGDGRFTVSGLAADRYTVWAHYEAGAVQLNSAPVVVQLESASETGLSLRLASGEQLLGTLEFEGNTMNSAPERNQKAMVHIQPVTPSFWTETQGGNVDREGRFSFTSVFPAKYRVRAESLPENAFIKSVSVDGAVTADAVIDFSGGVNGTKIKLTIGLNGASIEGTASSENGKTVCCAMVAVADRIEHVDDHMVSVQGGKTYRFTGLPPGKYRLIVSGPSQPYGTQTAEELFAKAPEIELHEGDHVTWDVTFKPRGAQ
jgi:hypothetical protein